MRRIDYLPNTNINLYQDSDMFRINSDTCALGEFLNIKKDDVVLDIGTNNGALLLYANKFNCKKLIGVDVNFDAIDLCEENMKLNNIFNYELYKSRIQDLNIDKVDVVVCNPPYFKNSLMNKNKLIKDARHEVSLTIEEVVKHSERLLVDNGKLMMVYKTSELINLILLLDKYHFGITRLKFIVDDNKECSNAFLIEAIKNRKHDLKALKPLIIAH